MKFNLRGLLQDEEFLVAAGLLQQGSQGKGIGEAFFPAITQAGQVKKLFQPTAKKTKAARHAVTGADIWATEKEIADSNGILIPIPKKEIANWKALDETDIETYNFITSENYGNYLKSDTGDLKLIPTRKKDNKNVTYRPLNEQDMAVWGIDEKNVDKYQIDNNNKLSLIPVEKTKDKKTTYRALTIDDISSYDGITEENYMRYQVSSEGKLSLIPIDKDDSTKITTEVNVAGMEGKYEETIGASLGGQFTDVMKASNAAHAENIDLNIITKTADKLETGAGSVLITDLMKWGQRFGLDVAWLSNMGTGRDQIANAEVINVLSGNQLFAKIQQTKGSISEKEMAIFERLTTSLNMSSDGIKNNAKIMKAINDREILKYEMLQDWISIIDKNGDPKIVTPLYRKDVETSNGTIKKLTFDQMWSDYVEGKDSDEEPYNPLIPKDELDDMVNLAESNKKLLAQSENYQFIPDLNNGQGGYIYIFNQDLFLSSNYKQGYQIVTQ